jgi:hypothetical protein|tara:strand:+ start:435 stop:962 length:528 start_codon:yes stop_codon:yes gene_type:complete
MFSTPIPGQSLTREPKAYVWEDPPEYSKPEDALMWHMDRVQKPERTKAILGLLELGVDVVTLTEGILRGAVSKGIHNIDVSLIIGPIIHEYISGTADAAGINFSEGINEAKVNMEDLDYQIREQEARKILEDIDKEEENIDLSPMEEEPMQEEMPMPQPEMQEEKPRGLMAREAS